MAWIDNAHLDLPDNVHGRFGLIEMTLPGDPLADVPAGLQAACDLIAAVRLAELDKEAPAMPEPWRSAVRGLLKQAGFKPTGRNKPSSEYLIKDLAKQSGFRRIGGLVDVNNLISLASRLPASILDADRFEGALRIRVGREGEAFVFNQSGQELDLAKLLLIADAATDAPLGNAIKDSMAGKLTPESRRAVGVLWGPPDGTLASKVPDDEAAMQEALDDWRSLTTRHLGATEVSTRQLVA